MKIYLNQDGSGVAQITYNSSFNFHPVFRR